MADIYGMPFEYNNLSSKEFGLIIANVETDRAMECSGEIEGQYVFNKKTKSRYLVNNDYSGSPRSIEIDVLTADGRTLDIHEQRKISKWLLNKYDYRKLYLDKTFDSGETVEYIKGQEKRLYLNCRFINPQKLEYNGGVVGWRVTLDTDSGMFWQDAVVITYDLSKQTLPYIIKIPVDTDIDDYTYPEVTINADDTGGTITIINTTDDTSRITRLIEINGGAVVNMKSSINYVNGQYYQKLYEQNFIRLLDGINNISVDGAIKSISFKYQNRRFF